MKFAISNIALSAFDHVAELPRLAELGLDGLEVAPSRIWQDTWHGLKTSDVEAYRREAENAGLSIIGLHSLLFDQPDLGLFMDAEGRDRVLDFMSHLSGVCRDLGGSTLVWGAGRRRGELSEEDAMAYATAFFIELDHRIAEHGTQFCFEPLGPKDSDFLNSVFEATQLANTINRPSIALQLDAKGIAENGEMTIDVAKYALPKLQHVHVNEPGLGILGATGEIDHSAFATILREIGYDRFVSIEQCMVDPDDIFGPIEQSVQFLKDVYSA